MLTTSAKPILRRGGSDPHLLSTSYTPSSTHAKKSYYDLTNDDKKTSSSISHKKNKPTSKCNHTVLNEDKAEDVEGLAVKKPSQKPAYFEPANDYFVATWKRSINPVS